MLEQLLFMVKGIMEASTIAGQISVGNLKHKNLNGTVVPSQFCPESDNEDDDEEAAAAEGWHASTEDEGHEDVSAGDGEEYADIS